MKTMKKIALLTTAASALAISGIFAAGTATSASGTGLGTNAESGLANPTASERVNQAMNERLNSPQQTRTTGRASNLEQGFDRQNTDSTSRFSDEQRARAREGVRERIGEGMGANRVY